MNAPTHSSAAHRAAPYLLFLSLFLFFPQLRHPFTQIHMTVDSLTLFYPTLRYTQEALQTGRLPLICDASYHGAPLAALRMNGLVSPPVLAVLGIFPMPLAYNILYVLPILLGLWGVYYLVRSLGVSSSGAFLAALLWVYNGTNMGRLDAINLQWINALFPWALMLLIRSFNTGRALPSLGGGILWGLGWWMGHPQMVLFQGMFLFFLALFYPTAASPKQRVSALAMLVFSAAILSSPLWLHTAEVLIPDGYSFSWDTVDRFYHSWTPLNFITLLFPWFFGKTQMDGAGNDYWWQYHFNEMQAHFSIAGLVFILYFLARKNHHRRWISFLTVFCVLMALGRFSPLYHLLSDLPVFAWFRDPARWWFPASWALSLGAAWAWDDFFSQKNKSSAMGAILLWMGGLMLVWVGMGNLLLRYGRGFLESSAKVLIRNFLIGDPLHHQPLETYMARLPEKWAALLLNLDPCQPRVFVPLAALVLCAVALSPIARRNPRKSKAVLLGCVLLELSFFRFPYGRSIGDVNQLPQSQLPPGFQRVLSLNSDPIAPSPEKTARMSIPNFNLLQDVHALPAYMHPPMGRYDLLLAKLGWFSWVYHDRDPKGFARHSGILRAMGVDRVATDRALRLPSAFRPIRTKSPFLWGLSPVASRAMLYGRVEIVPWPQLLDRMDAKGARPLRMAFVEEPVHPVPLPGPNPEPIIRRWDPTRINLLALNRAPALLVLQKTALTGWKALINGNPAPTLRAQGLLLAVALPPGPSDVRLEYNPIGLRLALFLSLCLAGISLGLALQPMFFVFPFRRGENE